eukprot:Em0017g158a
MACNTCRIAFHGVLHSSEDLEYQKSFLPHLKVYKLKTKEGVVERIQDERTVIGRGLFKRETKNPVIFSGKFRVNIPGETSELEHSSIKITMTFKRYVFDPEKKLVQ